jgi:CheY-like chemotaxis protein
LHGGSVQVFSAGVGKGSEFVVRLPAAAQPSRSERLVAGRKSGAAPEIKTQTRQRVLVVDDNVDSAESLAKLLGMMGYEVRTAYNGLSVGDIVADFRPRVVLLDIGLPGLDGYEVARGLRAQQRAEPLLLVALTGYGQESDRQRSREAGFDFHLVKPLNLGEFELLLRNEAGIGRGRPGGRSQEAGSAHFV